MQQGLAEEEGRQVPLLAGVLLAIGVLVFLFRIAPFSSVLAVPVLWFAWREHGKIRSAASKIYRLKNAYDAGVLRLTDSWQGEGLSGEEFAPPEHVYASDLNVFGTGSLFELLCTARTAIGRRRLAHLLLGPAPLEECRKRQDAVVELRERRDLFDRVAVLGEASFTEAKWETFVQWLDSPPVSFSPFWLPFALAGVCVAAVLVLVASIGSVEWAQVLPALEAVLALHLGAGWLLRERVARIADGAAAISVDIPVLREGLQLLAGQKFHAERLRELAASAQDSAASIVRLARLLGILDECNKDWCYVPGRVLLIRHLSCIAIERWRAANGPALREWMAAWGEFEALLALGNYAFENPAHTMPVLAAEGVRFEARALGHPLLAADRCVPNDVAIGGEWRFYIVSGSNMSGKSTLLRSIGLNAVLAFAGAPVRAVSLCLSELATCASLSVTDSILNGKSRFLAEVDRIRQTIELAAQGRPVLFLVDEIFSGTNSRDRRAAAEAVVRTLVEKGAIGALSTHDIALTEIATAQGLVGTNMHMGSKGQGDPLDFDYVLKEGVTQEANALAIARLAGVPV